MKVATHDGLFHADECFAIAVLYLLKLIDKVFRSRDPKLLEEADLRIDVGGKSDPTTGDFDHHQKGGAGFRDNGVPYASFGLVWKQYGTLACNGDEEVARLVDEGLVQAVDATDCGFALYGDPKVSGIEQASVSAAISALNPGWNEENAVADFQRAFEMYAVNLAMTILSREIARASGAVLARDLVRNAMAQAADPRLIMLLRFLPWTEIVVAEAPAALFVVFPDPKGEWRIQAIPPSIGSFGQRKPLPESWAGKRGAELATITGVEDSVFCHPQRFIAGAKTREGVLKLA